MGNYLPKTNSYFRCSSCHFLEGWSCLPWKKINTFIARQDSQKENEGVASDPIQDDVNQTYTEELCYILIDHKTPGRRPSASPAEEYYENIYYETGRPREPSRGTETEYSVIRVSSAPQHRPSPESEYQLLMPSRVSSYSVQQPRPLTTPFETGFSH